MIPSCFRLVVVIVVVGNAVISSVFTLSDSPAFSGFAVVIDVVVNDVVSFMSSVSSISAFSASLDFVVMCSRTKAIHNLSNSADQIATDVKYIGKLLLRVLEYRVASTRAAC